MSNLNATPRDPRNPSIDSNCRDCFEGTLSRRAFLGAAAAAATIGLNADGTAIAVDQAVPASKSAGESPETLASKLYHTLTPEQRQEMCFEWDYADDRGRLRSHVSNNWHITDPVIASSFYTNEQQDLIEALFWGLYHPDWHARIRQQLKDDAGDYGKHQSIALFGKPDSGQFEFVMTGRHLTIRCDGDSVANSAFGGPIFYGHAAQGFNEEPSHPGNVYWNQALKANALFQMLDGKQRASALIAKAPPEAAVSFRKPPANGGEIVRPGIAVKDLSADQKNHAREVLQTLIEPYRQRDQVELMSCLDAQGGLDNCHLSFYESDDLGKDKVWDTWRLEGPAFVWHYRGNPHVHVWVNVASNPAQEITTRG